MLLLFIINSLWLFICSFTLIFSFTASFLYILGLTIKSKILLFKTVMIEDIILIAYQIIRYPRFITSDSTLDMSLGIPEMFIIATIAIYFIKLSYNKEQRSLVYICINQFIVIVLWIAITNIVRERLFNESNVYMFTTLSIVSIIPLILNMRLLSSIQARFTEESIELMLYSVLKTFSIFSVTEYIALYLISNPGKNIQLIMIIAIAILVGLITLDKKIYSKSEWIIHKNIPIVIQYSGYLSLLVVFITTYILKIRHG